MSFKLDVDRLVKDELEVELQMRGIVLTNCKVEELKSTLRSCLVLEKSGKIPNFDLPPDIPAELTSCENKLKEILNIINAFTGTANQIRRIETKFAHLSGRLNRIHSTDTDEMSKRSALLKKLMDLIGEYTTKSNVLKTSNVVSVEMPTDPNFYHHIDLSGLNLNDPNGNSTPTRNISAPNVSNQTNQTSNSTVNPIVFLPSNSDFPSEPVYKWGIKYSGKPQNFSVFLEEVEEYCRSRNVNKVQLFSCARDLFTGNALGFYKLYRNYASNWDSLVSLMKEEFTLSADEIWQDILHTTQESNESIGMFVAKMTSKFEQMPTPVPDSLKMQVLLKNILPFYQERLTLVEVKSPFDLIDLCRKIEQTRINIESFKPSSSSRANSSRHHVVQEVEAFVPKCWRCNEYGHVVKDCKRPKRVFRCFGCNKEGFTKNTCPQCNSQNRNNNNSRTGNNSGNNSGNGNRR
ncbi:uncharacterized protein LOC126879933 [Diabrotica virgifera virgifera]|uniref:CCHC-type domain-containing protein n=1 Tax=Diabrotica virgifera virgifera TaxID=50390 RepID=A0ABM5JMW3_DIAVI|nr:uncharacterized protein LOC126879933 [Diabrotica virgifera virgifera]